MLWSGQTPYRISPGHRTLERKLQINTEEQRKIIFTLITPSNFQFVFTLLLEFLANSLFQKFSSVSRGQIFAINCRKAVGMYVEAVFKKRQKFWKKDPET